MYLLPKFCRTALVGELRPIIRVTYCKKLLEIFSIVSIFKNLISKPYVSLYSVASVLHSIISLRRCWLYTGAL